MGRGRHRGKRALGASGAAGSSRPRSSPSASIASSSRFRLARASARASGEPWGEHVFQPTEESHLDWYRNNHTVDSLPIWKGLNIPVLALYGTGDRIVPPSAHADRLREALGSNAEVHVYEDADHRLETALGEDSTGTWRWFRLAPGSLDTRRDWLNRHVGMRVVANTSTPRADETACARSTAAAPPSPP